MADIDADTRNLRTLQELQKLNQQHLERYSPNTQKGPLDLSSRGSQLGGRGSVRTGFGISSGRFIQDLEESQKLQRLKRSQAQRLGPAAMRRAASRAANSLPELTKQGGERLLNRAFSHITKVGLVRAAALLSGVGILATALTYLIDATELGVGTTEGLSDDELMAMINPVVDAMDIVGDNLPEEGEVTAQNERLNAYAPAKDIVPGISQAIPRQLRPYPPLSRRDDPTAYDVREMIRPQTRRPAPAGVAPPPVPAPRPFAPDPPPPVLPAPAPAGVRLGDPAGPTAPEQAIAINPPAPQRAPILATPPDVQEDEMDRAVGRTQRTGGGQFPTFEKGGFDSLEFQEAFKRARASGLSEFTWRNRRYTTKLAGE